MKNKTALNRNEMKAVKGGVGEKYIWSCRDTASNPYGNLTCSSNDPAAFCGQESCFNTGTLCTGGKYCP